MHSWSSHFDFYGSLQDQTSLIEAIKQVDVVICAVSSNQVLGQKLLIAAIKQAGCVKVIPLFLSHFIAYTDMSVYIGIQHVFAAKVVLKFEHVFSVF